MKNKNQDMEVLRLRASEFFNRPLFSTNDYMDILLGRKRPLSYIESNNDNNNQFDLSIQNEIWFGEYLYYKIQESNLTLSRISEELFFDLELLYKLLEDEVFPWEIEVSTMKGLIALLNLSIKEVQNNIKKVSIPRSILKERISSKNIQIAARSDKDLTDKERKSKLMNTMIELEYDRENKRRNDFINKLEER